jgi:GNAT superfamily N-acetyltransferase
MNITLANQHHAQALSDLAVAASQELRQSDFSEEAWQRFLTAITPMAFEARLNSADYLILLCIQAEQAVGFISLKSLEKIEHLFVHPQARNLGIATALWQNARDTALKQGAAGNFWLRSAPAAVQVYEHFGFKKDGDLQTLAGIRFQLMQCGGNNLTAKGRAE